MMQESSWLRIQRERERKRERENAYDLNGTRWRSNEKELRKRLKQLEL